MALAATILVGESQEWIPEIVEKTKQLTVGPGADNFDIAPMITKQALDNASNIIKSSETDGSKILLDGRNYKVAGGDKGNFLGPTIIDHSNPGLKSYDEEIFGPVMVLIRRDTI